jgi:GDPmannose 4,6-dehydratase
MKKNVTFISGIGGQDGAYLSEHLIAQGYEVHGMIRRHSVAETENERVKHLSPKVTTHYGDMLDPSSVNRLVREIQPDLIFNLAAQSHVRVSFEMPIFTLRVNTEGALNMLEAYRIYAPHAKYYQASSSEMFGNSVEEGSYQNEKTPMHPVSPYGCSKLASFHFTQHYRRAYGLFACNGILFNHTSFRRGSKFVIPKIVMGALNVYAGKQENLTLGNLDAYRDWGYAGDYVKAMCKILGHDVPDDFVIATGENHSIREICEYVFNRLGMNYQDHILQDQKFMRADELKYLKGDAGKAQEILGWENTTAFNDILEEILEFWAKEFQIVLPEKA